MEKKINRTISIIKNLVILFFVIMFALFLYQTIKLLMAENYPDFSYYLGYQYLILACTVLFLPLCLLIMEIIYQIKLYIIRKAENSEFTSPGFEFINVHCHLINHRYVPDSFINAYFYKICPIEIKEWIIRFKFLVKTAKRFILVFIQNRFSRIDEWTDIFLMNSVFHLDEDDCVAEVLVREMDESKVINLATPLMMDLGIESYNEKPDLPYYAQIREISRVAAQFPCKLMPFIMFDPRRKNAFELAKNALMNQGFLGVKIYPTMGYNPDPDSKDDMGNSYNEPETNKALEALYIFCCKNNIPITTHCSRGGAFAEYFKGIKEEASGYCSPDNWKKVLEQYNKLRLNFAHFGGDLLNCENENSWSHKILELIKDQRFINVYTDVSYHEDAFLNTTQYFDLLNELLEVKTIKDRILFGTDWNMTRHTWREKDYVRAFIDNIKGTKLKGLALKNPLKFLFGGQDIPQRIQDFYRKSKVLRLPDFEESETELKKLLELITQESGSEEKVIYREIAGKSGEWEEIINKILEDKVSTDKDKAEQDKLIGNIKEVLKDRKTERKLLLMQKKSMQAETVNQKAEIKGRELLEGDSCGTPVKVREENDRWKKEPGSKWLQKELKELKEI